MRVKENHMAERHKPVIPARKEFHTGFTPRSEQMYLSVMCRTFDSLAFALSLSLRRQELHHLRVIN